jgi:hypothetical protein
VSRIVTTQPDHRGRGLSAPGITLRTTEWMWDRPRPTWSTRTRRMKVGSVDRSSVRSLVGGHGGRAAYRYRTKAVPVRRVNQTLRLKEIALGGVTKHFQIARRPAGSVTRLPCEKHLRRNTYPSGVSRGRCIECCIVTAVAHRTAHVEIAGVHGVRCMIIYLMG